MLTANELAAMRLLNTQVYSKEMNIPCMLLYLLAAKDKCDQETVEAIANDLICKKETVEFLSNFIMYQWDRYGLSDLKFVYDIADTHECVEAMLIAEKEEWKKITWDYYFESVHANFGLWESKNTVEWYLTTRMMGAYKNWFLSVAQRRLPELTRRRIDDYAHIRRITNKTVDLRANTNDEIIEAVNKAGDNSLTWRRIDNIRVAFGYQSEERTLPMFYQKDWKKSHSSCAERAKKYMDVTTEMIDETLSAIQTSLDFSNPETEVLRNWINRFCNSGYNKNDGIELTDSLKIRYDYRRCFPGKTYHSLEEVNKDSAVLGRVRAEIRTIVKDGRISVNDSTKRVLEFLTAGVSCRSDIYTTR